jgi:hypothetical protein
MRRTILLAAVLMALAPLPARAAHFSGAYLYHICASGADGKEKIKGGHTACEAYIDGVLDYHAVLQSLGIAPSVNVCVPDGIGSGRLRQVVQAYMERNPQNDSFIAAPNVTMALYEIYPCRKGGEKKSRKK